MHIAKTGSSQPPIAHPSNYTLTKLHLEICIAQSQPYWAALVIVRTVCYLKNKFMVRSHTATSWRSAVEISVNSKPERKVDELSLRRLTPAILHQRTYLTARPSIIPQSANNFSLVPKFHNQCHVNLGSKPMPC